VDGTALAATSRSPTLFVGYLEAYRGILELWLWDCRIAISVSKSTAVLFVKAVRSIKTQISVVSIKANTVARYLGVIPIHG
jgi:hypothetical protein